MAHAVWKELPGATRRIPTLDMYTDCAYTREMEYEWDPGKARENLKKHGVDFADAVISLEDENALTIEDKDHNEVRFKTLGMGPYLNVLYVVHAEISSDRIRIISARKAGRKETDQYFRGISHE